VLANPHSIRYPRDDGPLTSCSTSATATASDTDMDSTKASITVEVEVIDEAVSAGVAVAERAIS
jgi:hypothetical protein